MALGCGATCAKYILFTFNLLFWLSGVAILGLGVWLHVDSNSFLYKVIQFDQNDQLLKIATYVLIGVGAFIFVVGFLGCCGACRESTCMLCLYALLLVLLLLAEIVAIVLAVVYKAKVEKVLKDGMKWQVQNLYKDDKTSEGISGAWNQMQMRLMCCGAYDYKDYVESEFREQHKMGQPVPLTCCKMDKSQYNSKTPTPRNDIEALCLKEATTGILSKRALHHSGCYDSVLLWLKSKAAIIIAVGCGITLIQIIGVVFACCVRHAIRRREYDDGFDDPY